MPNLNQGSPLKGGLAAVVMILGLLPAKGFCQEPTLRVLRDWQDYNNIGWKALNQGNLDRAAQGFRMAIEAGRPYPLIHKDLLARSHVDYARVLYRQKRFDEAEPLARWALSVREREPGKRAKPLCENLELLARIQRARNHDAEAEPILKRLSEIQIKELGPDHNDLVSTFEALANVYSSQGKIAEAEPAFRRALALREVNSAENLKQAELLERDASLLRLVNNDPGGALAGQREALARTLRETTVESPGTVETTQNFALMLRRAGRVNEADDLEARSRAIRDAIETRAAKARARR